MQVKPFSRSPRARGADCAPRPPKKILAELPQIMRDHLELANGIYRKSCELLIDGETDTFFFQFDDAWTDALPVSITAAEL